MIKRYSFYRIGGFISFLLCFSFYSLSQNIRIDGKVKSTSEIDFIRIMAVNQQSNMGVIGGNNGHFSIECKPSDTIAISVIGYETSFICMKDSIPKKQYDVTILLKPILRSLPQVNIFNQRALKKIYKDISTLGYSEKDYRVSGVDAIESPITFLYESLSRRAKAKRKAVELQNEERRRDLLKELFRQYVSADIIDLDAHEFDVFIDYCRLSDFVLQHTTQYEFILLIKQKYHMFKPYRH